MSAVPAQIGDLIWSLHVWYFDFGGSEILHIDTLQPYNHGRPGAQLCCSVWGHCHQAAGAEEGDEVD